MPNLCLQKYCSSFSQDTCSNKWQWAGRYSKTIDDFKKLVVRDSGFRAVLALGSVGMALGDGGCGAWSSLAVQQRCAGAGDFRLAS